MRAVDVVLCMLCLLGMGAIVFYVALAPIFEHARRVAEAIANAI